MKYLFSVLLLLVSVTLGGCQSHTSIASYMDELAAEGEFNGNILVIKNGEALYENSFGFADASKTEQLTREHRFGLGSIYKEFPAVAIMQLQEKGLLSVDDKIDTYLKDLPVWASKISIRNLLQYTSGLPKVAWEKYLERGEIITDAKIQQDLFNVEELNFVPSEDYLYTNYSPMLLAQIVEVITGQTFNDYVFQNLFLPYSINNATTHTVIPFVDRHLMAIPFDKAFKEDAWKLEISGALFYFTARDLYQWVDQLHAYKIISAESFKLLSEEADFFGNIQAPLGSVKWGDGNVVEHTHHGENGNFESVMRRYYSGDDELTIIVFSNQKRQNMFEISDEIKSIVKFD
ncbi:beta-lactamase family protein [Kordiimonas sp. SCSIO 12603]|uniref:serine hydrolase domain-containing protein n=1 Tax=Kordiimonas sp. SCSIO 12603 TaxID=2829596 RepID=UPI0021049B18|nr:serine hydrolase domain-containing protein [Kordiimonas sp. SCSIO 12603]UTW57138.1 beta-lactamase family protein [Kordiimonas sp. SCSIO 12603]